MSQPLLQVNRKKYPDWRLMDIIKKFKNLVKKYISPEKKTNYFFGKAFGHLKHFGLYYVKTQCVWEIKKI